MTRNEERLEALEKRWEVIDNFIAFCVRAFLWIVLGFCFFYTILRFSGCLPDETEVVWQVPLDESNPPNNPDGNTAAWACIDGSAMEEGPDGTWRCKE